MAEVNRVSLTSLGPGRKDKKSKEADKTIRFSLTLGETTEESCPEFNYSELVSSKSKTPIKTATNGSDPHEEDDANLRAMAKHYESKYGGAGTGKRKKFGRFEDYTDLGAGYDENDSFIDNTDAVDELVPDNATTFHGGFYINSGALEFKEVEVDSEDSNISDKQVVPPKRKRSRIIDSDEEDPTAASREAMRKKLIQSKKKAIDGLRKSTNKGYTVKDLLHQKRHKDGSVKSTIPLDVAGDGSERRTASTASICDAIESVVSVAHTVSKQAVPEVINPSSPSSLSDAEDNIGTESGGAPVPLPECTLPDPLVAVVMQLKGFAGGSEGKCRFFSSEVNSLLLQVDSLTRLFPSNHRHQVFAHLAGHLPCTKETLMKRAKKLSADQIEAVVSKTLGKLENGVKQLDREVVIGCLLEVTRAKVQYFELVRPRKESPEDFLKNFFEKQVVPMWPNGEVTTQDLYAWSSIAHSNITGRKRKLRTPESPLPMEIDPSPSTTPFVVSTDLKPPSSPELPKLTTDQPVQPKPDYMLKPIIKLPESAIKDEKPKTPSYNIKDDKRRLESRPEYLTKPLIKQSEMSSEKMSHTPTVSEEKSFRTPSTMVDEKPSTLSLFAKISSELNISPPSTKVNALVNQPKVPPQLSNPLLKNSVGLSNVKSAKSVVTFADSPTSSTYATAMDMTDIFDAKRYNNDSVYSMASTNKSKTDEQRNKMKIVNKPTSGMSLTPNTQSGSDVLSQIIRANLVGFPSGQDVVSSMRNINNKPLDMCMKLQQGSSIVTTSKPQQTSVVTALKPQQTSVVIASKPQHTSIVTTSKLQQSMPNVMVSKPQQSTPVVTMSKPQQSMPIAMVSKPQQGTSVVTMSKPQQGTSIVMLSKPQQSTPVVTMSKPQQGTPVVTMSKPQQGTPVVTMSKPQQTTSVVMTSKHQHGTSPVMLSKPQTDDFKVQRDMEQAMFDLLQLSQASSIPVTKSMPKPSPTNTTSSSSKTTSLPTAKSMGFQDAFFKHLQADLTSPETSPPKTDNPYKNNSPPSSTIGWESYMGSPFPSTDFYANLMGTPFTLDSAGYASTSAAQISNRSLFPSVDPNKQARSSSTNNKHQRTFL